MDPLNRELKADESLNGGKCVIVGDCIIDRITSYEISSESVYDSNFSFVAADGTEQKAFLGTRKKLSLKTGRLYTDEASALMAELSSAKEVYIRADGLTKGAAKCTIDAASAVLDKSDFSGDFYYVSFTASETGLTVPEGL